MPKTTLSFYLHIIAVAVIVVALSHVFYTHRYSSGGAATVAAKESVYDRVMRTKTIRCGYVLYPAYVRKDPNTGEMSGAHYDIINTMGKHLGLKIEWAEEVGWGNFIEGLQSRRYDMLCSGGWQSANEGKLMAYAPPIHYSALGVWVRSDDTRFDANPRALDDAQYSFVATDGSLTGTIAAEEFPKARINSLSNMTDFAMLYENVASGKADAVLAENYSVEEYARNNPGKLKNLFAKNPVRVYPVVPAAYVNDDLPLHHMVTTAINELINSGVVEGVQAKYKLDNKMILPLLKPYQLPTQQ